MEALNLILTKVSDFVWGPPLLILLLGTHLYLTIRLRFIQRYMGKAIRLSMERSKEGKGDISQFGALMTAMAATIGTGNIVGVATAVASGGPGAVFWLWLTGVFGIATKYAEAVLSVKYRITTESGAMAGGPMYVLERGVKCRWLGPWLGCRIGRGLGLAFALFTTVAAFGIGNMVQANSVATMVRETFGVSQWITGGVITVLAAVVILGGIKSISAWCSRLVPFMAVFFVVGAIILLAMRYDTIPETLRVIVSGAFTGQAAVGGFLGATVKEAVRYGIARGLFSNESGLGSAPIVAAAAQTKNPVRQALVSSTGTFWDTVVTCALTGLVIVNSGRWVEGHNGAALTKAAFEDMSFIGPVILSVSLLTFVSSTILGWSYYGEKAAEYLFGARAIKPYRWLWVAAVMVGSVSKLQAVWSFADVANALMAIPNVISLFALTNVVVAETRKYLWQGDINAAEIPDAASPVAQM
jgi:AGCS family alanine or glycine:cation symporter